MDPVAFFLPINRCNRGDDQEAGEGWSALANGVKLPSTSPAPSPPASHLPSQLCSPTQHEIDAHPIRQRLSTVRDDISTTLGSAPAIPIEKDDSRQEEELSQPSNIQLPRAMTDEIKTGDQVSWAWGGARPSGEAAEVKEHGEVSVTTHRGNVIKKTATPDDPAVKISRAGNDVVKNASSLQVDEPGPGHDAGKAKEGAENGDATAGEKRKADDDAEGEKGEAAPADAKKQKTNEEPKANGSKAAPKKKGRPAKAPAAKKETKKRQPKKAATESGEPRRSGRNAGKA